MDSPAMSHSRPGILVTNEEPSRPQIAGSPGHNAVAEAIQGGVVVGELGPAPR